MKHETLWLCSNLKRNAELMDNEAREIDVVQLIGKLFKVKTIQRQKRVFGEAVSSPPLVLCKHGLNR